MDQKVVLITIVVIAIQIVNAQRPQCPSDPNCICSGTLAVELNCNIDGHTVNINLLPNIYIDIKCVNATSLDYDKLPKCANGENTFKSVSFKDCPLPKTSFKDVLTNMGVSKTMALIFQNPKNLSGYLDRKHFTGLQDLTKLLLSIKGVTHLPNNLFVDINKLTWLNIRSNSINLSEELFKPLERLETLEISHNHMTNISSNLFSHLSLLRKLSLWQSNVTWFSKDLFSGVDVLEELDLSSNGLNELPSSIFKPLKRLKKLTLFSNKFSSLPHSLFKNNKQLETVVILNNDDKLKELPKYLFGNLTRLTQIYIQRSGLEIVPEDVFAESQQITNISLAHNDLITLPELVFNDQVNLLDLDLSYNKLTELKLRLFSSLLKLERLNLCRNLLQEISGPIFTPLYSLTYLNMDNNKLKTITTNLFSNTGQSMIVSLAYNKLKFQEIIQENCTRTIRSHSPFMYTYKMKLLNLSHNEFEVGFPDWWMNGHESLDISYNRIKKLWDEDLIKSEYMDIIKKPPERVWLSNNRKYCECENYVFILYLRESLEIKIMDLEEYFCPSLTDAMCTEKEYLFYLIPVIAFSCNIYIFVYFCCKRMQDIVGVKVKMGPIIWPRRPKNNVINLIVRYAKHDKEFVLTELVPILGTIENLRVIYLNIEDTDTDNVNIILNRIVLYLHGICVNKTIFVFSSNFLTSKYKHVDIKKIYGEMLKTKKKKSIYMFADIGPENSVYAFLKSQRDENTTIVWNEPNFWYKCYGFICDLRDIPIMDEKHSPNILVKKLLDLPVCYNNNSTMSIQV